jgi:hypothetical protein
MGNITMDNYNMSLAEWFWTSDRTGLLFYVLCMTTRDMLVLSLKLPEIDLGLFARPFTQHAWLAIGIIMLLAFFCIILSHSLTNTSDKINGYQGRSSPIYDMNSGTFFYDLRQLLREGQQSVCL